VGLGAVQPLGAIKEGDREAALALVKAEIEGRSVRDWVGWAATVCAAFGAPTPTEIVRELERGGVEAIDSYRLFGWYIAAREAAVRGDAEQAFEALRTSLAYWSNPPMWFADIAAKDAMWGELSLRPEFAAAFAERRRRIGPMRGMLHYFPSF